MPPSPTPRLKPVAKRRRFSVIMAGGVGTRFWPWSRKRTPKQLLALASERTMLEDTAARVRGLVPDENIIVVTAKHTRAAVAESLPWLPRASILCEPVGRNTAPCIGWAALEVAAREPDGVMVVLAADHVIEPKGEFHRALRTAFSFADSGDYLTTFGVPAREPSTGYGYIKAGRALDGPHGAFSVEAFIEKPSPAKARRYVKDGKYYWNSGMFAWKASTILEEFATHLPELARNLERMDGRRRNGVVPQRVVDSVYPGLDAVSIDYGIMEKSGRVAVLPAAFEWSDIGSWEAVAELWPSDEAGNRSRDPLLVVDAADNVVASNGKPVALLGVEGLVVVDCGDALLVCRRERCQDVRKLVEEAADRGLDKLL